MRCRPARLRGRTRVTRPDIRRVDAMSTHPECIQDCCPSADGAAAFHAKLVHLKTSLLSSYMFFNNASGARCDLREATREDFLEDRFYYRVATLQINKIVYKSMQYWFTRKDVVARKEGQRF